MVEAPETAMRAQPTAPVARPVVGALRAAPGRQGEAAALAWVAPQARAGAREVLVAPGAPGAAAAAGAAGAAAAPGAAGAAAAQAMGVALAAPDPVGILGAVAAPVVGVGSRRTRARDGLLGGAQRRIVAAGAGLVLGCARPDAARAPAPQAPPFWTLSPERCPADHVREYFCDELLPMTSALPAPAPYANCPASIESHSGLHEPSPPIAVFDVPQTARTRARMPPGHTCCYSWCAALKVVSSSGLAPLAPCERPTTFREHYCFPELESESSLPAGGAFSRCAAGIVPPAEIAFEVPRAAFFDPVETLDHQARGLRECCYGWCSKVPGTSGLERLF